MYKRFKLFLLEPYDYEEVGTICDNTVGADIQTTDNFVTFLGTAEEAASLQRRLAWSGVKVSEIKQLD
jgi:hypothetical protein